MTFEGETPMDNDITMNNECFIGVLSIENEPEEQGFDIILSLTQDEKHELISLWKAWKTRQQIAV